MTTSANSNDQGVRTGCTPQSFVKGLYLLTKAFIVDCAVPLAMVALIMSLLVISSIPAVNDYRLGADDFALASVAAIMMSLGCGTLAYFIKPRRNAFVCAGLIMLMIHMLTTMVTVQLSPALFMHDGNWWQDAPPIIIAALMPMFVTIVLLQVAAVLALLGLAGWGMYKLPKAIRAAGRHICRAGQGR